MLTSSPFANARATLARRGGGACHLPAADRQHCRASPSPPPRSVRRTRQDKRGLRRTGSDRTGSVVAPPVVPVPRISGLSSDPATRCEGDKQTVKRGGYHPSPSAFWSGLRPPPDLQPLPPCPGANGGEYCRGRGRDRGRGVAPQPRKQLLLTLRVRVPCRGSRAVAVRKATVTARESGCAAASHVAT